MYENKVTAMKMDVNGLVPNDKIGKKNYIISLHSFIHTAFVFIVSHTNVTVMRMSANGHLCIYKNYVTAM